MNSLLSDITDIGVASNCATLGSAALRALGAQPQLLFGRESPLAATQIPPLMATSNSPTLTVLR